MFFFITGSDSSSDEGVSVFFLSDFVNLTDFLGDSDTTLRLDDDFLSLSLSLLLSLSSLDEFQKQIYKKYSKLIKIKIEYGLLFFLRSSSRNFEYKDNKIQYIIVKMNKILDISYSANSNITRSKLKSEANKKLTPLLKQTFENVLDECRKITRLKQKQIMDLRKELDNFVLNMIRS